MTADVMRAVSIVETKECLTCGHKWTDKPGARTVCFTDACSGCGSLTWVVIDTLEITDEEAEDMIIVDDVGDESRDDYFKGQKITWDDVKFIMERRKP